MKLSTVPVFLAMAAIDFVTAAPMETCATQSSCISFTATQQSTNTCSSTGTCSYQICAELKLGGSCVKSASDTVSHTCIKNSNTCPAPPAFVGAKETASIANTHKQCQIVAGGATVEFLFKDGKGCDANTKKSYSLGGLSTTCEGRTASTASCTGNKPGVECIWTVTAPKCTDSKVTPVTSTVTAPVASPVASVVTAPVASPVTSPVASPVAVPVGTITTPVTAPIASPVTSPVASPVTVPVGTITTPGKTGSTVLGDPHFLTRDGTFYSYHGQCDLVMAHSSSFASGLGLDVHARTEIVTDWSLVSNAAVRIGSDIFELSNDGVYYFNGVPNVEMPVMMGGQFVLSKSVGKWKLEGDKMANLYTIHLDNNQTIAITQNMKMISVKVDTKLEETVGMLGSFMKDGMVGRDGQTVFDDANQMGQEWQVNDKEQMLFHDIRAPQFPERCQLPSVTSRRRRLRHSNEKMTIAEEACSKVVGPMHQFCVEDVFATGNVNYADGYSEVF